MGPTATVTRLDTWLVAASLLFAAQALGWVVLGSFDPFGVWDGLAADAFHGGHTPPAVEEFRRFLLGPFGATTAGYFVLFAAVARYPFRAREPWALVALSGSLALWFTVDSLASLARGGLFNVVLVNVPCALILGLPLWRLRPLFGARDRSQPPE